MCFQLFGESGGTEVGRSTVGRTSRSTMDYFYLNICVSILVKFKIRFLNSSLPPPPTHLCLKVPKREIFDRSDFPDFYTIKSLRVGDFGVKIKKNFTNI
jgi:hypothetical protein